MIKRLRSRFIRIATLSVAAVMLLLTVILNVVNYVSTDSDLRSTLTLIYENQGTIPVSNQGGGLPDTGDVPPPEPPQGGPNERDGHFTPETPFSTRYFVLRYEDDGTLVLADLTKIASVTDADTAEYLTAALKNGEGYGRCGSYRFFVAHTGDDQNMAIFLDSYQQFRAIRLLLLWSLLADVGCTLLVLLLVVLLSRRAIDPVVRSAQQQKQFITDASHELKTPITVIATSLKVLEMEVGQQKWIDKAQTQTEKLTELVNSLVTLSRMDEEDSPLKMEPFPVSDAVSETAESFRDLALSRGHPLELTVQPELTYRGDEYAVRQLTSILLDNALKYSPPGGEITVTLARQGKSLLLTVANTAQTLSKELLENMFDRFYRGDKARSSEQGGYGIGLSIAKAVVQSHKGKISAAARGDQLVMTVVLPAG